MRIQRIANRDGNLAPRAFIALANVPDRFLHHASHGKRHPKSAYGASLQTIFDQWAGALDQLSAVHREHNWEDGKRTALSPMLSHYRELLYRLNEHTDACLSALRSLCPPDAAKPAVFDHQFLEKAKPLGWKQFREATAAYRQGHIGALVNAMKHRQAELCWIVFYSQTEFRPGYYLKDIHPNGSFGPSPSVHQGGNTGFSFARDMLMHFWWLYRIGDLLADAVATLLKVQHHYELEEVAQGYPGQNLSRVIEGCAALKPEFFPDEALKPYPRIICRPDFSQLVLEFPTTARGHRVGEMQVETQLTVDGAHPSNKMPYFPA